MTKTQIREARILVRNIQQKKKLLAKCRDELRVMLDDLEQIVGDVDTGIEDIESGVRSIESGLDVISGLI